MPDELVAVQLTVFAPNPNVDADAGNQLSVSVPSLKSVAVGVV